MFSTETAAFTALMATDGPKIGFRYAGWDMSKAGIVARFVL